MYSSIAGKNFSNPAALMEQLSSAFDGVSSKEKTLLIIDSLSTLLFFHPPNAVYHFLFYENKRLKSKNHSVLYTIQRNLHSPEVIGNLIRSVDSFVELKK